MHYDSRSDFHEFSTVRRNYTYLFEFGKYFYELEMVYWFFSIVKKKEKKLQIQNISLNVRGGVPFVV